MSPFSLCFHVDILVSPTTKSILKLKHIIIHFNERGIFCCLTHLLLLMLRHTAYVIWHIVVCLPLCNSLGYFYSSNFGSCHSEYQSCCSAGGAGIARSWIRPRLRYMAQGLNRCQRSALALSSGRIQYGVTLLSAKAEVKLG